MLTKKQFITRMEELKELYKIEDEIRKAFKKLDPDFGYFSLGKPISLITNILEDTFHDESQWISYFIYDLDWGKRWTKKSITDNKGKSIKMSTLSELYNVLTENLNKETAKC